MQLVINSYGASLHKSGNCFLIRIDDMKKEVSADKVSSILISTSALISTDAIELAMINNIDIIFLNKYGEPFGRVWHSKIGNTTIIRRWQLMAVSTASGLELAKSFVIRKSENQIEYLKDLKKNRMHISDEFSSIIGAMEIELKKLEDIHGCANELRGSVMGYEGFISRKYFEGLSLALPDKWRFLERSRQPAKDGFNAVLNYGYGVLYSLVERGCIIAGLDPYIGILHTDNYNKPSFVFDLIEIFRIHIDRVVMNLFTKKQIKDNYFDDLHGGYILNSNGKSILITALNEMFESKIHVGNRVVTVRSSIPLECHRIANHILMEAKKI